MFSRNFSPKKFFSFFWKSSESCFRYLLTLQWWVCWCQQHVKSSVRGYGIRLLSQQHSLFHTLSYNFFKVNLHWILLGYSGWLNCSLIIDNGTITDRSGPWIFSRLLSKSRSFCLFSSLRMSFTKSFRIFIGLIFSGTGFLIRRAFIRTASLVKVSKLTLVYWATSGGRLYLYWQSSEINLNLKSALSLPSLFLNLLSTESSFDKIDSDGGDEYLRCFFFLLFLLLYRRRFFDFSDHLFGERLLFSSMLL